MITSAGLVLAATFAVLGTLPLVFLAEMGTAVALGVMLDTIIVRSVLVTALNLDLGSKIWWPSKLDREPVTTDEDEAPGREVEGAGIRSRYCPSGRGEPRCRCSEWAGSSRGGFDALTAWDREHLGIGAGCARAPDRPTTGPGRCRAVPLASPRSSRDATLAAEQQFMLNLRVSDL